MSTELESQLAETKAKADAYKQRIDNETINREIDRAGKAANAFTPSQLRPFLRCAVRTNEAGKEYTVALLDDGTAMSVAGAIQVLRESGEHNNLFTDLASVKPATPAAKPATGVDVTKLSHAEYRKLRQENPAALGLRPRGSRR